MERPSMNDTLMDIARTMSRRSTCSRAAVGCVVAMEGRILSSGFNGAPAGMPHCDHTCTCCAIIIQPDEVEHVIHAPNCAGNGCEIAVHAEANAIAFAARHGIALLGSTLFTTLSPCVKCAQLIINAGIFNVICGERYRDNAGVNLIVRSGITIQFHNTGA